MKYNIEHINDSLTIVGIVATNPKSRYTNLFVSFCFSKFPPC